MTQYFRGRRKEWEVVKTLKAAGYRVVRSAGSHGPWDVCAVSPIEVILIQVKYHKTGKVSSSEISDFQTMAVPSDRVRKEVWIFTKGKRNPQIIVA